MTKLLTLILILFTLTMQGASVSLAWYKVCEPSAAGYIMYYGTPAPNNIPTTNVISAYTDSCGEYHPTLTNIAYRVYTCSINVGNANFITISNLVEGVTYCFAVTVYNALGLESEFSNEIIVTIPVLPNKPENVKNFRFALLTIPTKHNSIDLIYDRVETTHCQKTNRFILVKR